MKKNKQKLSLAVILIFLVGFIFYGCTDLSGGVKNQEQKEEQTEDQNNEQKEEQTEDQSSGQDGENNSDNADNKDSSSDKSDSEKSNQNEENSTEEITLKFLSISSGSDNSYDEETQILKLNKQWDRATFDVSNVSINGKYLVFEYENLSGSLNFDVNYTDGTTNTIECYYLKNKDCISLDQSKKISSLCLVSASAASMSVKIKKVRFSDEYEFEKSPIVDSKTAGTFNESISALNLVKDMGVGFNVPNYYETISSNFQSNPLTHDTPDVKLSWGNAELTENDFVKPESAGVKTIRIPVTWANHIVDDKYTIDPFWMEDVKKFVDLAYKNGYYVILNEHHSVHDNMNYPIEYHEGYIIRNTEEDIAESERFLKAIWEQIAKAFNNSYDEHLIFETMNEPRNTDTVHHNANHMWNAGVGDSAACSECIADHNLVNKYNKLIIDTIRASGGNNAKRFVMIPSVATGYSTILTDYFKIPEDSASDKLILTVHDYPLWNTGFNDDVKTRISSTYSQLNEKFVQKGYPIVIGELGYASNQTDFINNVGYDLSDAEKLEVCSYVAKTAAKYGISTLLFYKEQTWDNPEAAKDVVEVWNEVVQKQATEAANEISLENVWLQDSENSSFDSTSGMLEITGQYKRMSVDLQTTAETDKYLVLEYANLSGTVVMEVTYKSEAGEDSTCSNVTLDSAKNQVYIQLDTLKSLQNVSFISYDETKVSVKITKLRFADEV